MRTLEKRFQRAALILEAARLESYIDQQLGLTIRQRQQALDTGPDGLVERLTLRWNALTECRETANKLRQLVWNLE